LFDERISSRIFFFYLRRIYCSADKKIVLKVSFKYEVVCAEIFLMPAKLTSNIAATKSMNEYFFIIH